MVAPVAATSRGQDGEDETDAEGAQPGPRTRPDYQDLTAPQMVAPVIRRPKRMGVTLALTDTSL